MGPDRYFQTLFAALAIATLIGCAAPQRQLAPLPISEPTPSAPAKTNNSFGMEFIQVPAGTFIMGSPEHEAGRDKGERQHEVTLTSGFNLQTTEVTQGQWRDVMQENPSFFTNCGQNCPVEQVSWDDAQNFIAKLNMLDTDSSYRLPTEAEWEYAARAGANAPPNSSLADDNLFSDKDLDEVGWYVGNSTQATHPVAQKKPNAWGFYDMHGNVREWCADWFQIYPFNSVTDPKGPNTGWSKIRRGGSWNLYTRFSRPASRDWTIPNVRDAFTGLRLVQFPKPAATPEPAAAKQEQAKPSRHFWVVQFELDKYDLLDSMLPILQEVLTTTEKTDTLILEGHTCDQGTNPHNLTLSKNRVETVRDYLLSHQLKTQQVSIAFFGENKPALPNESEQNRAANRRVTIRLKSRP